MDMATKLPDGTAWPSVLATQVSTGKGLLLFGRLSPPAAVLNAFGISLGAARNPSLLEESGTGQAPMLSPSFVPFLSSFSDTRPTLFNGFSLVLAPHAPSVTAAIFPGSGSGAGADADAIVISSSGRGIYNGFSPDDYFAAPNADFDGDGVKDVIELIENEMIQALWGLPPGTPN